MDTVYVVIDLRSNPADDICDIIENAYRYETYATLQGAQAGADSAFDKTEDYEIWQLSAKKVDHEAR